MSTAGWAARPTTRPPSSARSAPTPSSTTRTRRTPALVQGRPGALPVLQPRDRPPADRPRPAADEVRDVCVHVERETDDGLDRLRRQGRRDRLGAHELQLHRPLRARRSRQGVRARLRGPDGRARAEADLAAVVRDDGRGDGQPVRLPAVERGWTRTTRSSCSTTCSSRGRTSSSTATWTRSTRSSRRPASSRASRSTGCTRFAVKLDFIAGCCSRASRLPAPRSSAACRRASARCSPGATCSGA